jgi:uncharacterized protein (DUF4415 family)
MKKASREMDPLASGRVLTARKFVRRRDAGKVVRAEAMEPHNIKVQISIKLDADVLEYFKARAGRPGASPYQTQINAALREAMERDRERFPGEALLRDDRFVSAITERIKARL